jgi:tripartite-type tricarboxylate transporter receptor subunit TctC
MFKKCFSLLAVATVLIVFTLTECAIGQTPSIPVADLSNDDFPSRPINIIVTYAAGGGSDMIARVMTSFLSTELGVPIMIENIPGSGTLLGGKRIADAEPDGYTIGIGGMDVVVAPLVHGEKKGAGFGQEDYQMIAQIGQWPHILAVKNDAPYANFNEFVAFAKEHPGELIYATAAAGGIYHINLEVMKKELGIDITHVPFNGSGETMVAVSGGHADAVAAGETTIRPLYEDHLIRPIVIMSDKKISDWPDIPNFEELGLKSRFYTARLVFGPAGIPQNRLKILETAFLKVLSDKNFLLTAKSIGEEIDPLGSVDTQALYNKLYDDMRPIIKSIFE